MVGRSFGRLEGRWVDRPLSKRAEGGYISIYSTYRKDKYGTGIFENSAQLKGPSLKKLTLKLKESSQTEIQRNHILFSESRHTPIFEKPVHELDRIGYANKE